MTLHLPNLSLLLAPIESKILHLRRLEFLLTRPLQRFRPRLIAKPIADEVRVAGVDQDRDLFKEFGHEAVEGLHPVAREEEAAIDIEVAGVVAVDFGAKSFNHGFLVEIFADPAKLRVA